MLYHFFSFRDFNGTFYIFVAEVSRNKAVFRNNEYLRKKIYILPFINSQEGRTPVDNRNNISTDKFG